LTIKGRVQRFEDSLSSANPLSEKDRCQVITIPYGLDQAETEKLINVEQARILEGLSNKYGTFDEQTIQWIEIVNFSQQKPMNQIEVTNERP